MELSLSSQFPFEPAEERLLEWEGKDLWAVEIVPTPANPLDFSASNPLQDTVQESASSLKKLEEIPRKLLEDEAKPTASTRRKKNQRNCKSRQIKTPAKKERKQPLYTEDLSNLEASPEKKERVNKSKKCKLYRERKKAEKNNLVRQSAEKDERIRKLIEANERLQQAIIAKDVEIQNLRNKMSRVMAAETGMWLLPTV